jgi:hypothetical protein
MCWDNYRDCQQRAEAAMRIAIAAPADQRHVRVQVALLWQFLDDTNDARAIGPHPGGSKNTA